MSSPVLIIGIDGGTWDVLNPAIEAGCMPNLSKLLEKSAHSPLNSVIPAITPAAWGSFQTGKNPGQNGVYDFKYWDQNGHRQLVSSESLNDTIWEIAGKGGKKVGVLNVPMTYPPRKINGDMVCGVLTPGLTSNFTWPPELQAELLEAVPDYDILNLANVAVSPAEVPLEKFISTMNKNLDH
ncbi:MAG: alkaline phosphatase family protein, partial [Halanaerobiales bacterium]|nr:alkaline phosphatase family protein [Halanaerobiales bacterium]